MILLLKQENVFKSASLFRTVVVPMIVTGARAQLNVGLIQQDLISMCCLFNRMICPTYITTCFNLKIVYTTGSSRLFKTENKLREA